MDYRNIVQTVYKISDFISWQRGGSLVLSPSFQRRPVWPKPAKSYLIDTIVRGFPIPIIFVREKTDLISIEPKREVVDGQQRLRTIFSFIDPSLLSDYEYSRDNFLVSKSHNNEISGMSFQELETEIRQRILNYRFSVHVLPSDTEDRVVLQIFSRMNSTGIKLNRQELRNAEYIGIFKRLAYNLAYEQLNRWRNWAILTENDIARMIEVELTSDLLRTMLYGLSSHSQPALDNLYKDFEDDFPFEHEISRRFQLVMESIDEKIGNKIHGSPFSSPVLFHTLFTFFYDLLYGLGNPLDKRLSPKPISGPILTMFHSASDRIAAGNLPESLVKVLRGGTGNLQSRKERLTFLQDLYKSAKF